MERIKNSATEENISRDILEQLYEIIEKMR